MSAGRLLETIGMKALRSIDPETSHGLAIRAIQMGVANHDPVPGSANSCLPESLSYSLFPKRVAIVWGRLARGFHCFRAAPALRLPPGTRKPV